ncbi:MAG: hypothetical protein WC209_11495 [Ignavibacteriaceae bacterium]
MSLRKGYRVSRQRAVDRRQTAVGKSSWQEAVRSWQGAVGRNKEDVSLGFVILDLEFYRGTVTFLEKR